ncbi:Hypothetical protein, putative [Bodo saltans]|uniref:Uncharacterized protein n=1 Tax=Bodo saltans TaxID=75058 RepID=A0A0S4J126_BODSA|nr:Hypothetical protein, putative [Bodo saltans]|eukprot:CUG80013.1 Hypothetical protein, putative [Bodo saltans]
MAASPTPVLWVVSRNIEKYKGSLQRVGLGLTNSTDDTTTTTSASNHNLFSSTVRGTDASHFLEHPSNAAGLPIVLLLDNDSPNAGDIIKALFDQDASIRVRVKWIHTLSTGDLDKVKVAMALR